MVSLFLVTKNKSSGRFEAVSGHGQGKTEMILPVDYEDQIRNIEQQVECLLRFQEENQADCVADPEMANALTESINFVSSKGVSYFDEKKIEAYFYSSKERKRLAKDEPPELGGFINKPIIKQKSNRGKDKEPEVFFYQDQSGANIYLHSLCQEFIEEYVGLPDAPSHIKVTCDYQTTVIDVVSAHQNWKLRKSVK